MEKNNINETIDTLVTTALVLPFLAVFSALMLAVLVIDLPVAAIDKLGKKMSINVSKLVQLIICTALIGLTVLGLVMIIFRYPGWLPALILTLLFGFWLFLLFYGLVDAVSMVIRPNIPKMAGRKDVLGLISALEYDDWEVRCNAAAALREIGDDRASGPLKAHRAAVAHIRGLDYKYGGKSPTWLR